MMKIRKAGRDDIAVWSKMRSDLWPDTEDGHLAEIEEYFSGTSIDIAVAYVAESDKEIVGFLELNIRNFAEGSRNPKVPYLEAWYVCPAHQKKGYGKQLMRHAEQWAISLGCNELASDTGISNERSIAMHKHLGFRETERVVCFLKQLNNT